MNYTCGDELAIVPYVNMKLFLRLKSMMLLFTNMKILPYLNIVMIIMLIMPMLNLILRTPLVRAYLSLRCFGD